MESDPENTSAVSHPTATETPTPEGRPCNLCAFPLVFAPNAETGKKVPLDARSPVYALLRTPAGFSAIPAKKWLWNAQRLDAEAAKGQLDSVAGFHVTHFSTCKFADHFNKAKQAADAKAKAAADAEFKVAELAGKA